MRTLQQYSTMFTMITFGKQQECGVLERDVRLPRSWCAVRVEVRAD